MRIFICSLLFIFMIFFNSVQSMTNGHSSIYRPNTARPVLHLGQILYLRGHPGGDIFELLAYGRKRIYPEFEANRVWLHWEHMPISQGEINLENGDLLIRQRKSIAKFRGVSFNGIAPAYPGQTIVNPRNNDMVFRVGNPIARYENNVRKRIDFIDYTNNDDWMGNIDEEHF